MKFIRSDTVHFNDIQSTQVLLNKQTCSSACECFTKKQSLLPDQNDLRKTEIISI